MRPLDKYLWRKFSGDAGMYGTARQMMISTIGTYCAYCEVPLSVSMPIEHKVAKSSFPSYDNKYCNFVLACSACNSFKGAHPDGAEGKAFYQQIKSIIDPPVNWSDNAVQYWCALLTMVWPDVMRGKGKDCPPLAKGLANVVGLSQPDWTYNLFSYVRETKSAAELVAAGYMRLRSGEKTTDAWAQAPQDRVWVYPNAAYIGGSLILTQRVTTTILTMNLNYSNPTDLRASDRRVASRTQAWDTATGALNMLGAAITKSGGLFGSGTDEPEQEVYNLFPIIRQMALATGHWSVWMTVFSSIINSTSAPWSGIDANDARWLVKTLLVQYDPREEYVQRVFDFQPNPPAVFLGTAVDRIQI